MESFEKTLELFKQGNSMPEIAFKRKLAFSTIETHLRILIEKKLVKIDELLSQEKIDLIKKVVPKNPQTLREIKEALPEEVTYREITWVLASIGKFKDKKRQPKPPIIKAINTYVGNCCMRKCFNHEKIILDCQEKFDELAKYYGNEEISVSEFFKLMSSGAIKICKLPEKKRKTVVTRKYFEYLNGKNTDFWDA